MTLRHDIKTRIGDSFTSPEWAIILPGGTGITLSDGWTVSASLRRHTRDGGATVHTYSGAAVTTGTTTVTMADGTQVTTSTVQLHHTATESKDWPAFVGPWDFQISKGDEDYTIAAGTVRTTTEAFESPE